MRTFRLLCGLVLAASAAVFFLPSTREAAREQARIVLGLDPPEIHLPPPTDEQPTREVLADRLFSRYANVARSHPKDIGFQMGYAIADLPFVREEKTRDQGIVDGIRCLLPSHKASPDVYACLLLFGAKWVTPAGQPEFDRWAAAGERLEPTNAFFPAMRAVGLARVGRADDAIAAIERAAAKPQWDDHYATLLDGRMRLDRAVLGRPEMMRQISYAMFWPSQSDTAEELSGLVCVEARKRESAGDRASALRLRLKAVRLGNVWRNQSRTLYGNSVGAGLMGRTLTDMAKSEGYRYDRALSLEANQARARSAVHAYAKRAGQPDAILELDRAKALTDATRALCRAAWESEIGSADLLIYQFLGGRLAMNLLSAALWLTLIGAATFWVQRAGEDRRVRTMRTVAVWGAGIACFAWQSHGMMGVGFWVEPAGERDPAWLLGVNAATTGLSIALMARLPAEIAHFVRSRRWKREHLKATPDERRRWASADFANARRRSSLPAATVVMALFVWLLIGTVRSEARMTTDLKAQTTHEGRYYAQLLGKTWPE